MKIYQYDHRLSRTELVTLTEDTEVVIFCAYNYSFDLLRAFANDAKEVLLRRVTRFGDQTVSYYIYRGGMTDVGTQSVGYALDIMRLAGNLLDEKKRSLEAHSQDNVYFKKMPSENFLDLRYNAYDLLSEFELLVRCVEKAAEFLSVLEFEPSEIVDFVLRQNWYGVIESHISPIKFFESGSRIAKILVAPYAKFPSFPAFYAGGRVHAFKVGRFEKFAYYDINSEYPSAMSRLSPNKMTLICGKQAKDLAVQAVT